MHTHSEVQKTCKNCTFAAAELVAACYYWDDITVVIAAAELVAACYYWDDITVGD